MSTFAKSGWILSAGLVFVLIGYGLGLTTKVSVQPTEVRPVTAVQLLDQASQLVPLEQLRFYCSTQFKPKFPVGAETLSAFDLICDGSNGWMIKPHNEVGVVRYDDQNHRFLLLDSFITCSQVNDPNCTIAFERRVVLQATGSVPK